MSGTVSCSLLSFQKILLASDITGIQLAKVLGLIPNSIRIFTTYETYFFASFLHRDDAYKLLTKMSRGESIAHMGMWAKKGAKTDDELEEEGATTPAGAGAEGSDGEGDNGAAPEGVPRKKGHGRSGSMTASPRSPPVIATSEVRHASLLTGQAAKLKAEKELKRQNELKETQRKLRNINLEDEEEIDPDEAAAAEEEEEEERQPTPPPPKRNGKSSKAAPAAAAAAVAAASVAAASVAASKKGSKAPPRKATDDGSDGDAASMQPQAAPASAKKSSKPPPPARADEDDEADPDDLDEPEPQPAQKSKKGAATAAAASSAAFSSAASSPTKAAKGAANGSSKAPGPSPQALWLAAASNSGLPKPSEMPSVARRARFYEPEPMDGPDPAVVEVQRQFKNAKKMTLADPAAKRRLLHQGAMRRQGGWNVVDRWCFLFNDHFLFAEYDEKKDKKGSSNYVEKQRIALQYMTVDMRPQSYQQEALKSAATCCTPANTSAAANRQAQRAVRQLHWTSLFGLILALSVLSSLLRVVQQNQAPQRVPFAGQHARDARDAVHLFDADSAGEVRLGPPPVPGYLAVPRELPYLQDRPHPARLVHAVRARSAATGGDLR